MVEWHQVWKCEKCKTKRVYGGDFRPEPDQRRALVICEGPCSRRNLVHTWHVFVEMAKDTGDPMDTVFAYA